MEVPILNLIREAQSPLDDLRRSAEEQLLHICDEDASQVFVWFVQVAGNRQQELGDRQFALLTLRKLVTMYWSPGFESFRGTSTVELRTRGAVRGELLKLCLDETEPNKIRSNASYVVVQISAVDFPDQWPELLKFVYEAIFGSYSIAAMKLLNEIYDELISEEMFFEEGIGFETLKAVFHVINSSEANWEAKLVALNILHCCVFQMSMIDANSTVKRKELTIEACKEILQMWLNFLMATRKGSTLEPFKLLACAKVYQGLTFLKNEFSKKIVTSGAFDRFRDLAMGDLEIASQLYIQMAESSPQDQLDAINEYTLNVLEFLSSLCDMRFTPAEIQTLLKCSGRLCCLSSDTTNEWENDFNCFISKETGLVASFTVRDQVAELLSSLGNQEYTELLTLILHELNEIGNFNNDWIFNESLLYILQCLLLSESKSLECVAAVIHFLKKLQTVLEESLPCTFVNCRIILLLPKLLEEFMDSLPDNKNIIHNFLFHALGFALSQNSKLISSATLISFTYYSYFTDLQSVLGSNCCIQIQQDFLRLITQVLPDAADDTGGVLMEVLNDIIDCNMENLDITINSIVQTEFHLVFSISGKDPSNIQTAVQSQECLDKLLNNADPKNFACFWEFCFAPVANVMVTSANTSFQYSPLLSLTLQLLVILMKNKPLCPNLSITICNGIFEPLQNILNHSKDEEILQSATEALGYLIYNTEPEIILPHLPSIVNILDALLSPEVPDQAAAHVGSLTVTIFSKFSTVIQDLIPVILRAAVVRLTQATSLITTQNLLSIFCFTTCADPQQTVDFLWTIIINNQNGLYLVICKWLESFDVIRGEKRMKENITALSKLFFLNDQRLGSIQVNGDLIPYESDVIITRSMAKSMPDKYYRVSVYQKIVKLFISELEFQGKHQDPQLLMAGIPNIETAAEDADQDEDEDDWEDVGGPLEYERLQHYVVGEDHTCDDGTDNTDHGADDLDEQCFGDYLNSKSVHQLLVEFFKEVAGKNVGGFQTIYERLSDSEKQILSENLL